MNETEIRAWLLRRINEKPGIRGTQLVADLANTKNGIASLRYLQSILDKMVSTADILEEGCSSGGSQYFPGFE